MGYKYPVYQPMLSGNEKKYVNECLDSSWISSKGKFISLFEEQFASYIGTKYAASVSNGTVALHVALVALGIGPGDEVIVPSFTYIASVNAIAYTGARPVFVDSLASTWQMDPADVKAKITPHTKAILVVHLYGHPCEMNQLVKIARASKVFLVEDCAEAIGSKFANKMVGTFGDISCFSFFGNKTITTGEGGMVITNDQKLHNTVVHFKGQGLAKDREYWHDVIGYNYRMTNICAAIGLAQLEKVQEVISKKICIGEWYNKELKTLPVEPLKASPDALNTYWMYSLLTASEKQRDSLRKYLADQGIETRPTFFPAHKMPMYSDNKIILPTAEDIAYRGINLPSYPELTQNDIVYICSCIKNFMQPA